MNACIICKNNISESDISHFLTQKGFLGLVKWSKEKEDHLISGDFKPQMQVHTQCQKNYTRRSSIPETKKRSLDNSPGPSTVVVLRSAHKDFDFKTQCLFCADVVLQPRELQLKKKKTFSSWSLVSTIEFKETVKKCCLVRNDERSQEVSTRIANISDLIAAEARYHHSCFRRFLRDYPKDDSKSDRQTETSKAFEAVSDFLISTSSEICQYSISELYKMFKDNLEPNTEPWALKYFKNKLTSHFGDKVVISDMINNDYLLCFKGSTKQIIKDFAKNKLNDEVEEKERILVCAAEIIKEDILSKFYNVNSFPSNEEIKSGGKELLSPFLVRFLTELCSSSKNVNVINSKLPKILSIANALTFLVRPRSSLPPTVLALSVYLHRKFQNKDLCSVINKLGFGVSYAEVLAYENASVNSVSQLTLDDSAFIQFMGDNADLLIRNLNGSSGFHTMGNIMSITPNISISENNTRLPRGMTAGPSFKDQAFAPILQFKREKTGLKYITLSDIKNIRQEPEGFRKLLCYEGLWLGKQISFNTKVPSWQGYMSLITQQSQEVIESKVIILPFVNLNPGNMDTIYSTLVAASTIAEKYRQETTIITFDQPLYIKAVDVIHSSNDERLKNVIIRLGGFHLLMSFLGSIGNLMSGSGLEELWQTVYAKKSIPHMMNGHAYSRAVRAHLLTQQALSTMLLQNTNISESDKLEIKGLEDSVLNLNHPLTKSIIFEVKKELDSQALLSRTGKLWQQYWELVELLKCFIAAERLGDWELHLYAVRRMLPIFHATGHYHYAKSGHLYLQQMQNLQSTLSPNVFESFVTKGFFTVRRTKKVWSGTWSDMIIEQDLMRVLKVEGGLAHRSGLMESSIARWIGGMPQCSALITAFEEFTSIRSRTSEQHVELRESRKAHDSKDLEAILKWLEIHSPFGVNDSKVMVNLALGIAAGQTCNCDEAFTIGELSLASMVGKSFADVKYSNKFKVVNILNSLKSVAKHGPILGENSVHLFNRLMATVTDQNDVKSCFSYEFSLFPPSIFSGIHELRQTTKSELMAVFDKILCPVSILPSSSTQYHFYIDGGLLLHRLVWKTPCSYSDLFQQYLQYLKKHYGEKVVVIFDGYGNITTKSLTQRRRGMARSVASEIILSDEVPIKQAEFLLNSKNKEKFIHHLQIYLRRNGVVCKQADGDADLLLVETALTGQKSVVVSEDTDVMVISLHYVSRYDTDLWILRPGKSGSANRYTNVCKLANDLGARVTSSILGFHALTGCDTTSAFYKIGKKSAYKTFEKHNFFENSLKYLYEEGNEEDVTKEGAKIIMALYGGKSTTLNDMR